MIYGSAQRIERFHYSTAFLEQLVIPCNAVGHFLAQFSNHFGGGAWRFRGRFQESCQRRLQVAQPFDGLLRAPNRFGFRSDARCCCALCRQASCALC
jgi:hypothetical protein